ncbi:MAG: SET domain-containing protein-lysine N-methyltransferase [Patescibacteria group bacterium]
MKPTRSPYAVARKSKVHGKGLFAKKDIWPGTKIIEYVGNKNKSSRWEDDDHSETIYVFQLNRKYDIDGDVNWNTAKYINHSCDPNSEVDIIDDRIWIIAIKKIKKGQEITYNYGFDLKDWQEHPCRCGAKNCVGYIIDDYYWPKLHRKIKRHNKKKK